MTTKNHVTAKNIINRIQMDCKLLHDHPDAAERLQKRIATNEHLLLEMILNHANNPAFETIY